MRAVSYLLFVVLVSAAATAETADSSVLAEFDLVALANPEGLSLTAKAFRRQIYRHDQSPLWDGLYYQTGLHARVTPAFSRAGFEIEWMPVAVLQLRAEYDRLYFSGDYGSLLSFTSADQPFGDDELDARENEEVSAYGRRSAIGLTLRAKFGAVVIRNITDFMHYQFPSGGPFYLERENELLMASTDEVLSNTLYVLHEQTNRQRLRYAGAYYDYVHVEKSDLIRERLGLTWYQQYNKVLLGLQHPRWYVQAGHYLQDPNREGELYLLVGVGGDLAF